MATNAEDLEPQTALITVQEINAPRIFGDGQVQEILDYIRGQVADVVPDISTAKGRGEIKSAAYKITRSKTLLDDAGKEYAAELKRKVLKIDGHRKKLRDDLDTLKDEIRKPLTDWEEAQKARESEVAGRVQEITFLGQPDQAASSDDLRGELKRLKAIKITEALFDFRAGEAAIAKDIAVTNLERALKTAEKREAEAEELERLRKETAARDKKDAEDRRILEAEDRVRAEEDRKSRERVEKAEREAREAREAAARAEREAEERIESERREREEQARKEREEDERRAADREHRRKINSAAVDAICEWSDLSKEQAQTVIILIAAGRVPAVTIKY